MDDPGLPFVPYTTDLLLAYCWNDMYGWAIFSQSMLFMVDVFSLEPCPPSETFGYLVLTMESVGALTHFLGVGWRSGRGL